MELSNFEIFGFIVLIILIIYFGVHLITDCVVDKEMDDFKKKNGFK